MTLWDMIERIREMPGGILGAPSARTLNAFLFGFSYARKDEGQDDFKVLSGFSQFVHDRFRITSTQGWAKIIEFYTNTESDQMALFWKLWDEYCDKLGTTGRARQRNGEATKTKGRKKVRLPA